jgi:hypothetical protein
MTGSPLAVLGRSTLLQNTLDLDPPGCTLCAEVTDARPQDLSEVSDIETLE